MKKKTHGGPGRGQGRKLGKTFKEPTVPIRIPKSLIPTVKKLISKHKMKIIIVLFTISMLALGSCKPEPTGIKSSDIKDGAITEPKDHAQLIIDNDNLRKKLEEQEQLYKSVIDLHFEQNEYYQNQIDALIEACNKKDQQIKILSGK